MSSLPLLPPVEPGEVVAGKYRIDRVIGRGGMGIVVKATRIEDSSPVAIKILLATHISNHETVSRFAREGRAVANIKSSHVARVFDVGELADKTPFIVMEYLEGDDLARLLEERERIDSTVAVDWILEACEAIAEAHAQKIVHRDLKPSNLFASLAQDASLTDTNTTNTTNTKPVIKVLDFGISKMALDSPSVTTTKTSAVLGSPLYMSPEQLKSAKLVDERSDIWSIGVILYELISGTPPFAAQTLAELGALVLSHEAPWLGDAPSLATLQVAVPVGLSTVIATCLRRDVSARFVNLADFADAIAPYGTDAARKSAAHIIDTLGLPNPRARLASRIANVATSTSTRPAAPHVMPHGDLAISPGATPMTSAKAASSTRSGSGVRRSAVFAVIAVVVVVFGALNWSKLTHHDHDAEPKAFASPAVVVATTATATAAAAGAPTAPTAEITSARVEPPPIPTAAPIPSPSVVVVTKTTFAKQKSAPLSATAASSAAVPPPPTTTAAAAAAPPATPHDDLARSSKE